MRTIDKQSYKPEIYFIDTRGRCLYWFSCQVLSSRSVSRDPVRDIISEISYIVDRLLNLADFEIDACECKEPILFLYTIDVRRCINHSLRIPLAQNTNSIAILPAEQIGTTKVDLFSFHFQTSNYIGTAIHSFFVARILAPLFSPLLFHRNHTLQ
jgi:hypothetical protein